MANLPYFFNPYQTAQPVVMPQMVQPAPAPQTTASNSGNNLNWVQGEAGAKAYPVAPNTSVLLMDSEESVFYIKATDSSGMPQPLRIFDYTERTSHNAPKSVPAVQTDIVTREEFERLKEDVTRLAKGVRKPQTGKDKEE